MKLWTIQEIADLNIYSIAVIKKAIYIHHTLKVIYAKKVKSPRIRHDDLVEWLGFDPLNEPNITVEFTRTIKEKDKTTIHTTRIERRSVDDQIPLFEIK